MDVIAENKITLVQLNTRVPKKVHKEFKLKVVEEGKSMTNAITELMQNYINS